MARCRDCHRSIEPVPIPIVRAKAGRAAPRAALFAFCCALAFVLGMADVEAKMRRESLVLVTSAGEHVIDVEVAETNEEKALGLMFRRSVPELTGMLFPYEPAQNITMWMRNTYVSLDMIFIRADGVVHRIEARAEPLSERTISSQGLVTAVLELAAGSADRLGLRPGDKVRHPHFGTAKR